ncbi:MAG: helix-turn-helix transcriptional regulator [Baekduiaceae bacterium]
MARSGEARALRVAADLTLEEIASAVGVSRQALAGWEKGERRPGGNNARHYAAVLQELRDRAAKACTAR